MPNTSSPDSAYSMKLRSRTLSSRVVSSSLRSFTVLPKPLSLVLKLSNSPFTSPSESVPTALSSMLRKLFASVVFSSVLLLALLVTLMKSCDGRMKKPLAFTIWLRAYSACSSDMEA